MNKYEWNNCQLQVSEPCAVKGDKSVVKEMVNEASNLTRDI